MRIAAVGAMFVAVLGAGSGPAWATANWDYTCKAVDASIDLNVLLTFNQGTAGRIAVGPIDAAARRAGKDGRKVNPIYFASDDIEQFWVGDDVFRISLSRYNGGEPEPVQLLIDTTCRAKACTGTYRYAQMGEVLTGKIRCEQGEAG